MKSKILTLKSSIIGISLGLFASLALPTVGYATVILGLGNPLSHISLAGGSQEGFDSVATNNYASITLGNVTYIGVGGPLTIGHDYNGQFNTTGGKSMLNGFDYIPSAFRFNFSTPVNAFGFNWGASDALWQLNAYDTSNNLLDSTTLTVIGPSNAGEYFGLAVAGISYATLANLGGGDYVFIDRFTTSVVPEPTMLTLLGVSVVGLVIRRRTAK